MISPDHICWRSQEWWQSFFMTNDNAPRSGSTSCSFSLLLHPDPGACSLLFLRAWSYGSFPCLVFFTPSSGSLFYSCLFFLLPNPGVLNDDMFWPRILCLGRCRYYSTPYFDFVSCSGRPCSVSWLFSTSHRHGYFPLKLVFFCLNWLFSWFGDTYPAAGRKMLKRKFLRNGVGR